MADRVEGSAVDCGRGVGLGMLLSRFPAPSLLVTGLYSPLPSSFAIASPILSSSLI
jgi:hypothetical protein